MSYVQVDLHFGGYRATFRDLAMIDKLAESGNQICVTRGNQWRKRSEIYAIEQGMRLPVIGVPLREVDEDLILDLQAAA